MKTVIAGSRGIKSYSLVCSAVTKSSWEKEITVVISGCARGVDSLGERWALERGIVVISYPAEWHRFGRSAGHIRNAEMARDCDAVIAIWDGVSKGTLGMINSAEKYGKQLFVYNMDNV